MLGLAEFSDREDEVRAFVAARVWATNEGRRALSDRAVAHMMEAGITTLTRLISEVDPVPPVKLAAPARYGMASKAPTLPATVRHLETSSIDDALDVLDLLVTSNLLARAEQLRTPAVGAGRGRRSRPSTANASPLSGRAPWS